MNPEKIPNFVPTNSIRPNKKIISLSFSPIFLSIRLLRLEEGVCDWIMHDDVKVANTKESERSSFWPTLTALEVLAAAVSC